MQSIRTTATSLSLLGIMALGSVTIAAAPAAATGCDGSNSKGTINYIYDGAIRARTTSYDSTCDGDTNLVAYLADPYTDGYNAKVYIRDSNYAAVHHTTGGSAWSQFTYNDTNSKDAGLQGYGPPAQLNVVGPYTLSEGH